MSDHSNGANFWRVVAIALLTFVLGNGVAFVLFGIRTASKDDVAAVTTTLSARMTALETKNDTLEKTVNRLVGELSGKGIVPPTP